MVKEQIVIIFNENKKRYGYRRITKELHNNDICVNHKTVRKLMKQLGLVCQVRAKRKYSSYKGEVGEVAPNLLERHFKTNQPNRKWVTDVTEFKVNDQKLYLSPILDLFNGEVVSYNITPSVIRSRIQMTYNKVNDILDKNIIDPKYTDYADDLKLMRKLSDIIRKKMIMLCMEIVIALLQQNFLGN